MMTDDMSIDARIMSVFECCDSALKERDLDALENCYVPDVIVFDIGAQLDGFDKLRALWEGCFPYFPNPIVCERKDVHIQTSADVAIVSFFSRMSGMESDHPSARSRFRATVCLRRVEGDWKIFHEHASFPVDCGAEKPTYIMDES